MTLTKRRTLYSLFALIGMLALAAAALRNASESAPATRDALRPDAEVGEQAPEFTLKSTTGRMHALSDYEGQFVVLEWFNFDCPYTGKHYGSDNMQQLQKAYTDKDVVWLSISSSAPGEHGYLPSDMMNAINEKIGGNQTAILMDPTGKVGRTYGARVTPHMYVIDPEGTLIYKGGIDDRPTTDEADIKGAQNYVSAALDEAMNGEDVSVETAPPYGCPIKYAPEGDDRGDATSFGDMREEAAGDRTVGELRPNGQQGLAPFGGLGRARSGAVLRSGSPPGLPDGRGGDHRRGYHCCA